MTISVSRRLYILCIMFKPTAFFIITPFSLLYMKIGIFLKCGNYLHDRIISVRVEAWPIKRVYFQHFLLMLMFQPKNVSGHVFVCYGYRFCIFLRFLYLTTWYVFFFFFFFQFEPQTKMFCSWFLILESI